MKLLRFARPRVSVRKPFGIVHHPKVNCTSFR
jgi:hypothetical protein